MNKAHDRDASVERQLPPALQARAGSPAPGSCLDAEMLARWADGTLAADEFAAAETHVSDCSRCLALLAAMEETTPPAATSPLWWRRGLTLRWLVPLTAAATAIAIWVAVPYDERPRLRDQTGPETQAAASPKMQEREAAADRAPSPAIVGREGGLRADGKRPIEEPLEKREEEKKEESDQSAGGRLADERETSPDNVPRRQERAAADAVGRTAETVSAPLPTAQERVTVRGESPAAAPAGATTQKPLESSQQARAAAKLVAIEIVSPNPSIRWRAGAGGIVQYSIDSGSTWEVLSTGVVADLTAGFSPSSSVCWLVGRAGTVLLSTDGRRWQRVAFPERADLTAVRATDARTATVTTADGRTFSTTDGGGSWTR